MTHETVTTSSLDARFWVTPTSASWAVVEAIDPPRIYAGRVSELTIGGRDMLRIALPDGQPHRIVILSTGFIREILPCTEREARAEAALRPQAARPTVILATDGADDEPF